jgi:hypothetical protein
VRAAVARGRAAARRAHLGGGAKARPDREAFGPGCRNGHRGQNGLRFYGACMMAALPRAANRGATPGDVVANRWVPLISPFAIFRNSQK